VKPFQIGAAGNRLETQNLSVPPCKASVEAVLKPSVDSTLCWAIPAIALQPINSAEIIRKTFTMAPAIRDSLIVGRIEFITIPVELCLLGHNPRGGRFPERGA
jgi:hypothetical protein